MICDHVAWFLNEKGFGTYAKTGGGDIFCGYMKKDVSPHAWMVMSVGGLPLDLSSAYNHDHEFIEVSIRGTDADNMKVQIASARDKLLGNYGSILHASSVALGIPESPTIYLIRSALPLHELYRDNENRPGYCFGVEIQYSNLVSIRSER